MPHRDVGIIICIDVKHCHMWYSVAIVCAFSILLIFVLSIIRNTKKNKFEYSSESIFDLKTQIAHLAKGNLLQSDCTKFDFHGAIKCLLVLKKQIAKKDKLGICIFDVESRIVDNILPIIKQIRSIKKSKKHIHKLPQLGGAPRLFWLSKLFIDGHSCIDCGIGIDNCIDEFENNAQCTEQEHIWSSLVLAWASVFYVANIARQLSVQNKCILTGYLHAKTELFDLSYIDNESYLFGVLQSNEFEHIYKANKMCLQNFVSLYANSTQVFAKASKIDRDVYFALGHLQFDNLDYQNQSIIFEKQQSKQQANYQSKNNSKQQSMHTASDKANAINYPKLNVLTNGMYTSVIDHTGCGYSKFGGDKIFDGKMLDGGFGLYAGYQGDCICLYDNARHGSNFSTFYARFRDVFFDTVAGVMQDSNTEFRTVKISNSGKQAKDIDIVVQCNISSQFITQFDTEQYCLKVFDKDKLIACVCVYCNCTLVGSDKLVCRVRVQPYETVDFVASICMGRALQTQSKIGILQSIDSVKRCQNPSFYMHDSTKELLSKIVYQRMGVFPELLKVNAISGKLKLVCVELNGFDYFGLKFQLSQLKQLLRCQSFDIAILYSCTKEQDNQTKFFIQCLIEQMDLQFDTRTSICLFNKVLVSSELVALVLQHSLFFADNQRQNKTLIVQKKSNCKQTHKLPSTYMHAIYQQEFVDLQIKNNGQALFEQSSMANRKMLNLVGDSDECCLLDQFGNIRFNTAKKVGLAFGDNKKLWGATMATPCERVNDCKYATVFDFDKTEYLCEYNDILSKVQFAMQDGVLMCNINIKQTKQTKQRNNNNKSNYYYEYNQYTQSEQSSSGKQYKQGNKNDCYNQNDDRKYFGQNKFGKKQMISVGFFVWLNDSQNNIFEFENKGEYIRVRTQNTRDIFVGCSSQIQSFCASAESFCDQYGVISNNTNFVDVGGVCPCIAISCNIQLIDGQGQMQFWFGKRVQVQSQTYFRRSMHSQGLQIAIDSHEQSFNQIVKWLPNRFVQGKNTHIDNVCGLAWTNVSFGKELLIEYATSQTKSLDFVIALSRWVEICGHTSILKHKAKFDGKAIDMLTYCQKVLKSHCIFDASGFIIKSDNQIDLKQSIKLVYAIRQFLPLIENVQTKSKWLYLSDTLSDAINKHCFKGGLYMTSGKIVDLDTQCFAILSQVADKTRGNSVLDNLAQYSAVSSMYTNTLLFKAYLTMQRAQQAFDLLNSANLMSSKDGIFGDNFEWCGLLYDAIVSQMFGLHKSSSSIKFAPIMPQQFDVCSISILGQDSNLCIVIDNTKKQGNWNMLINNIRHSICGISLKSNLQDKTIILKKA